MPTTTEILNTAADQIASEQQSPETAWFIRGFADCISGAEYQQKEKEYRRDYLNGYRAGIHFDADNLISEHPED